MDGWAREWKAGLPVASDPEGDSLPGCTQPFSNFTPGDVVEIDGLNLPSEIMDPGNKAACSLCTTGGILEKSHVRNVGQAGNYRVELFHEQVFNLL